MCAEARADINSIRDQYNNLNGCWVDSWHRKTYHRIRRYVRRYAGNGHSRDWQTVLNQGSGGNSYDISAACHIHLDLANNSLHGVNGAVLGNTEKLPFQDQSFDMCVCVGSVINYCDAAAVIEESARALKPGGLLLLEFERSESAEYWGREGYGASQSRMLTRYGKREVTLWFYSEPYIISILEANGFVVKKRARFHVLSPLVYRLTGSERLSSHFAEFDFFAKRLPLVGRLSTNAIMLAEKVE